MKAIRLIALAACMAATLDASAQEQEIRLFSHRGGRMEHDENTLSAFQASYDAGYRGFEKRRISCSCAAASSVAAMQAASAIIRILFISIEGFGL